MPDAYSQSERAYHGWSDAFASLPAEQPPGDGWSRLSARLEARRRPQWTRRLAMAAALVMAVALPWGLYHRPDRPSGPLPETVATSAGTQTAQPDTLDQLYAESARLEALLQYARDDRVSSASAAAVASEMDARVATIDRALMQPGLSPEQQLWLWRSRVEALRSQAGFESTRRWLAANGERYDGAVARVD